MPSRASEPTPFSELNQVLVELVERARQILGAHFVGAYLQGSFAVGDFDEHSDVDFIVVLIAEPSDEQVAALQEMHGRVYEMPSYWAQHLEGSYVPLPILRESPLAGDTFWYLDNGSHELVRSDHCNTLVVRWTLREHGVVLAGPPPSTLLDAIPVEALRAEIRRTIQDWGGQILAEPDRYRNRFYQTYIVLSFCRMLHDLRSGRPGSKRAGAAWAKANLDPSWHGLIDRTWAGRPQPEVSVRTPPDPDDFASTLEFVRRIIQLSQQDDNTFHPHG